MDFLLICSGFEERLSAVLTMPRRSSSGNFGAKANRRPPKPQPMSATVTDLFGYLG